MEALQWIKEQDKKNEKCFAPNRWDWDEFVSFVKRAYTRGNAHYIDVDAMEHDTLYIHLDSIATKAELITLFSLIIQARPDEFSHQKGVFRLWWD